MSFIAKGRSVAVVTEASYAAAAPTFLNADYIDYTQADVSTNIEKIDRAVIRDSMLQLEPVLGQETSSGTLALELSATAAGILNGHKLYANGIGKEYARATATTATAGTVNDVTVTSAAGLNVGQVISVAIGAGVEFVAITAIVGLVVSVTPAFTQAPIATAAVQGLLTYVLPKPSDSVASLAIRENLKPTSGTPIDYDYLGCMVSSADFTYPVGGIATSSFSVAGAGFTIDGVTAVVPTLPCSIATPIVGKNGSVKVLGTSYTAQDVSFTVATDITDIMAITTDGITNKLGTGKTVTGKFKTEYVSTSNMDSFKAGTKGALVLLLKDGGKTSPVIHGVIAPQVKFTNVTRSDDGGVLYDNVDFQVLSPDCGTVERALSVFFV